MELQSVKNYITFIGIISFFGFCFAGIEKHWLTAIGFAIITILSVLASHELEITD